MSNACVKVTVSIDRAHKNRLFVIPNTSADQRKRAGQAILHHLVLSHTSAFSLHSITSIRVGVFDVGQAKWSSTVLITGEFCYRPTSAYRGEIKVWRHLPIAVSASSAELNSTTPVPLERPLGSYWISALSTFPMVVKSSTRSSLLVDQGSCTESAEAACKICRASLHFGRR